VVVAAGLVDVTLAQPGLRLLQQGPCAPGGQLLSPPHAVQQESSFISDQLAKCESPAWQSNCGRVVTVDVVAVRVEVVLQVVVAVVLVLVVVVIVVAVLVRDVVLVVVDLVRLVDVSVVNVETVVVMEVTEVSVVLVVAEDVMLVLEVVVMVAVLVVVKVVGITSSGGCGRGPKVGGRGTGGASAVVVLVPTLTSKTLRAGTAPSTAWSCLLLVRAAAMHPWLRPGKPWRRQQRS